MKYPFAVLLVFSLIVNGCSGPKLMSYEEFSQIEKLELPVIVHLKSDGKQILYFGSYHSNLINDSLFSLIERKFNDFQPDFVLHEGDDDWPIFKNKDSTIVISGEPGYIIQLSQENEVDYATIEPEEKNEYEYLLKTYDLEWVVLMYMCRQIDNQQRLSEAYNTSDAQFEQNMDYFFRMLERDGIPLDKGQMEFTYWKNIYEKLLNRKLEWRKFNPDLYYPNKYLTKLNEINRASDEFRNLFMIEKILETSDKFDKIMVLVGGGHLIVQEKLLKSKFEKRNK